MGSLSGLPPSRLGFPPRGTLSHRVIRFSTHFHNNYFHLYLFNTVMGTYIPIITNIGGIKICGTRPAWPASHPPWGWAGGINKCLHWHNNSICKVCTNPTWHNCCNCIHHANGGYTLPIWQLGSPAPTRCDKLSWHDRCYRLTM